MPNMIRLATAGAIAALLSVGQVSAQSENLAEFFEGETVTILTGHPPGGSYDLYAQLAARHLGKHIPGNPEVIVQHMPGGGGSIASAHFANRSTNDGTVIGLLPEPLAAKQLMEPESSHWDLNEMRYIGRFNDVRSVMMVRDGAPAQTVEQLREIESPVGCTGTTSSSSQTGAVTRYFTDLKFRMVCGYDGSSSVILALTRGEVDLTSSVWTNWLSSQSEAIESGAVKPILQFGLEPIAGLEDVMLAIDLIDDPAAKSAMKFFAASGEIGRSLIAPPGMSDELYQMYTEAFDAMVTDPEFLADTSEKGIPLNILNGAGMEEVKTLILSTPEEDVKLLATAMDEGFN